MGNSVSCFDPVREHPPYSWPKDHPGRDAAIEERRRVRKNQKIVGAQGTAKTVARDPSLPIAATPIVETAPAPVDDEEKKPLMDDAETAEKETIAETATTTVEDEDVNADKELAAAGAAVVADEVSDEKKEEEKEDGEEDANKQDDTVEEEKDDAEVKEDDEVAVDEEDVVVAKEAPAVEAALISEAPVQAEAVEEDAREAALESDGAESEEDFDDEVEDESEVENLSEDENESVDDPNPEEADGALDVMEQVGADEMATAAAVAVAFTDADKDQVMDTDIGIEATPVDEKSNEDDELVQEVDDEKPVTAAALVAGEVDIDSRRAMFDKGDDELPQAKELRRDVYDPVSKEYVSLEEYRKRQREQAQGVVKERVEKFEEIDDERSRQLAEHAAIEAARAEAIANAEWRFKNKERLEAEGLLDPEDGFGDVVEIPEGSVDEVKATATAAVADEASNVMDNVPQAVPAELNESVEIVQTDNLLNTIERQGLAQPDPPLQPPADLNTGLAQPPTDLLAGLLPDDAEEKEVSAVADKIPELQSMSSTAAATTTAVQEEAL